LAGFGTKPYKAAHVGGLEMSGIEQKAWHRNRLEQKAAIF
jgi:hypothetical protein